MLCIIPYVVPYPLIHLFLISYVANCSNNDNNDNDSSPATVDKDDASMEIEPNTTGTGEDTSTNAPVAVVPSFGFTPTMWMGFSLDVKASIANGCGYTIAEFEKKYLSLGIAANNSESSVSSTDR